MTEAIAAQGIKEEQDLSIFYEPRTIEEYKPLDNEQLLKLAFKLKDRRRDSIEGLLYLSSQENTKNLDQILGGENELEKRERKKYISYIIQKHQRWLPTELKVEKLTKRLRRTQTFRPKADKKEKKEKIKDEKEEEKEDLNLKDSPANISQEEEDFEDLEELDQGDMSDAFEDNDDMRGSDRGRDGDGDNDY